MQHRERTMKQNRFKTLWGVALGFALLAVVLGCQLFLAGFLGELISGIDPKRDKYLIEKTLE